MKPQPQPRSIRVLQHATAFCASQVSSSDAFSTAECRSHHAARTKPDPISNPTTPSYHGTGLPPCSSHPSAIQIP